MKALVFLFFVELAATCGCGKRAATPMVDAGPSACESYCGTRCLEPSCFHACFGCCEDAGATDAAVCP